MNDRFQMMNVKHFSHSPCSSRCFLLKSNLNGYWAILRFGRYELNHRCSVAGILRDDARISHILDGGLEMSFILE